MSNILYNNEDIDFNKSNGQFNSLSNQIVGTDYTLSNQIVGTDYTLSITNVHFDDSSIKLTPLYEGDGTYKSGTYVPIWVGANDRRMHGNAVDNYYYAKFWANGKEINGSSILYVAPCWHSFKSANLKDYNTSLLMYPIYEDTEIEAIIYKKLDLT